MECLKHITARKVLFRGGEPWPGAWRTRTDPPQSSRGQNNNHNHTNGLPRGSSHARNLSYASIEHHSYAETTEFHGWLDRAPPGTDTSPKGTVNSACMESSRDNLEFKTVDLTAYDAIEVVLGKSDGKVYTIALEDERQFLSWEGQFRCVNEKGLMTPTRRILRLGDLVPRRQRTSAIMRNSPRLLDARKVGRFRVAIFNSHPSQEGPFSLSIYSINAVKLNCSCPPVVDPVIERQNGVWNWRVGAELALSEVKNRMGEVALFLRARMPELESKLKAQIKSRLKTGDALGWGWVRKAKKGSL
ncbi:uncharacterized protein DSM5745_00221 [Aspergillus mulundensis]|uniref:NADH:ubiquinone oxidoreductase intermediate-associated protein 30 domain-containing protein n=1 Tax=Aspergillus mulundensis TaxID=1810919 RepID=A0A3D8T2Z9_9EURO|nr:hypothetical protein DSM5745_00221 [Aspergillus mulundensis]RDW92899.1 hypothetical protein DSM5745_00221 [Aspergillus mulundensis]